MTEETGQQTDEATGNETPLDVLLAHLERTRGFDFTGSKRTSLERRIRKRMDAVGVDGSGEYLDYLEVHQHEFPALFDVILINVTGSSATRRPGSTTPTRSSRTSSRRSAPAIRSACGAPGARRVRRRTRWPWSSLRRWASTATWSA